MAVTIIVRNITAGPLYLDNLSVENRVLLPNVDVNLTIYNRVYEIQSDPQLQQYIIDEKCVLNDGTRDLTQDEAINVAEPVISTANIYKFTEAPEKLELSDNDLLLAEDSEDNFKKKKIKAANIVFLGDGTLVYAPIRLVETGIVYTSSNDPIVLFGMEFTADENGNYEIEFNGQFACLKGKETVYIAVYLDNTLLEDTIRVVEADSYVIGQTEALLENVNVGQIISIQWVTSKQKRVVAAARSLKVSRYV